MRWIEYLLFSLLGVGLWLCPRPLGVSTQRTLLMLAGAEVSFVWLLGRSVTAALDEQERGQTALAVEIEAEEQRQAETEAARLAEANPRQPTRKELLESNLEALELEHIHLSQQQQYDLERAETLAASRARVRALERGTDSTTAQVVQVLGDLLKEMQMLRSSQPAQKDAVSVSARAVAPTKSAQPHPTQPAAYTTDLPIAPTAAAQSEAQTGAQIQRPTPFDKLIQ